jgi:hypothetical protein
VTETAAWLGLGSLTGIWDIVRQQRVLDRTRNCRSPFAFITLFLGGGAPDKNAKFNCGNAGVNDFVQTPSLETLIGSCNAGFSDFHWLFSYCRLRLRIRSADKLEISNSRRNPCDRLSALWGTCERDRQKRMCGRLSICRSLDQVTGSLSGHRS